MHYLDNAATTRVSTACADMAVEIMTANFGNPSSLHTLGICAQRAMNLARERVASAIGADKNNILFTSCGTEADNMAVFCGAQSMSRRGKHIITTAAEHPAILNPMRELCRRGYEITYLPTDKNGLIQLSDFENALRDDTILVSVMLVNNESGAIMPIAAIKNILKRHNSFALLHTDAVQALGKIPIHVTALGVDLLSVSGHKIHAPKGIGALYIRSGLHLPPLIFGGGQENGLRSGTEGLPLIAAFGTACENINLPIARKNASELKSYLTSRLAEVLPSAILNFPNDEYHISNISSVALPNCKSEVVMRILESRDVYVSSGSACSKGKKSSVLSACGLSPDIIDSTIRISFGDENTREDIDALIDGLCESSLKLNQKKVGSI